MKSLKTKAQALTAFKRGVPAMKIAALYKVHVNTVYRWATVAGLRVGRTIKRKKK